MKKFGLFLSAIFFAIFLVGCSTIYFDYGLGSGTPTFSEGGTGSQVPDPIVIPPAGYSYSHWSLSESSCDENLKYDPLLYPPQQNGEIRVYACYVEIQYTVTFYDYDGTTLLGTSIVTYGVSATPPQDPERLGYSFVDWDTPFTFITSDTTVTAQYVIRTFNLIFYEEDGLSVIETTPYVYETSLVNHQAPSAPNKLGYDFDEWTTLPILMPAHDLIMVATYSPIDDNISMVQVGLTSTVYTIPLNFDDCETRTVDGGYFIATHETTYELWVTVREWAVLNNYHFQHFGLPGSHDSIGNSWRYNLPQLPPPLTYLNKNQPVTYISWRDIIVWINALSEKQGLDPVYRTSSGNVIRDSRDYNATVVDAAVDTRSNGYRLPTYSEWEMAARWKYDSVSTNNSIFVGGRYWTPGDYASGAIDDYTNDIETRKVAWYSFGLVYPDDYTRNVGMLLPNHLEIYDMSGNVLEMVFDARYLVSMREGIGGCFISNALYVTIGGYIIFPFESADSHLGFRLVRWI